MQHGSVGLERPNGGWAHCLGVAAAVLACPIAVFAQIGEGGGSSQGAEEPAQDVEEIVVTGSYIKGTPEDAISPVLTLSHEQLVQSGASDLAELVRNLELASGSDTAVSDTTRFTYGSGTGLSNVALRGLGPAATLVLLDGKRLPFAGQKLSDGTRFVDINQLPISVIERVEILKDGGTALYGSDAIAGTVNFVTRSDFKGLEVSAKSQMVTTGSTGELTLSALYGFASKSGSTRLLVAADTFDRSSQLQNERFDLYRNRFDRQDVIGANVSSVAFSTHYDIPPGGTQDPGGCVAAGLLLNDAEGTTPRVCYRNGSDTFVAVPALERSTFMLHFTQAFGDAELVIAANSLSMTSGEEVPIHLGPIEPKYFFPSLLGVASGNDARWNMNPVTGGAPGDPSVLANGGPLPAAAIPGVALPLELVDFSLRAPGFEPDRNHPYTSQQDTSRLLVGFNGEFGQGQRWTYDVSYTLGASEYRTRNLGIDKNRLELAMYGLGGPNCVPNGSLEATDPRVVGARAILGGVSGVVASLVGNIPNFPFLNIDNLILAMTSTNQGTGGCQFYNPFLTRAPGSAQALTNSDELLRWLEVDMVDFQKTETAQNVLDAVFTTSFDAGLAGGDIGFAAGMQLRQEERTTSVHPQLTGSVNRYGLLGTSDQGVQAGGESVFGLSENANFSQSRDILALFGEVQVPLLPSLDLQLALRYEDYGGSVGNSIDPKAALRWQMAERMVLRGSWGTAFRGPTLAHLHEGTGYNLEFGVLDRIGETDHANGAHCVRTGQCDPDPQNVGTAIIVKQGQPSPNLKPETADVLSLGFVLTAPDGEGFSMALDYYRINFSDKIIDVPTQSYLTEEFANFLAAREAGNYVIVDPTEADFGMACDPTEAEFQYTDGMGRQEKCQVNPSAYATPSITRRPDDTASLQIVRGPAINTGSVVTSGLDFSFGYGFLWPSSSLHLAGSLTNVFEYAVSDFPVGQPDFEGSGFSNRNPNARLARSIPDLRGSFSAHYRQGAHSSLTTMRYIGEYQDNALTVIGDGKIGPYIAFDSRYSYSWEGMGSQDSTLELAVGVIDLLDEELPVMRTGQGTDLSVFDVRGRRIYFSGTWRYQ